MGMTGGHERNAHVKVRLERCWAKRGFLRAPDIFRPAASLVGKGRLFRRSCQKVVALAHEVGVRLDLATVDLFKGEARTPTMLAKNPNGKLPILEDGDFTLWESTAMLGYVAAQAGRADLAPTTPRERAEVERWTSWQSAHFGPAIRKVAFERIVKKLGGLGAPDEAVVKAGIAEFATTASVLEQSLGTKEYVCGRLAAEYTLKESVALAFVAALQVLTPPQRAVLLLRNVVGLSAAETAEALACSVSSANSTLHRARVALEERVGPRAGWSPEVGAVDRVLLERYVRAWEKGGSRGYHRAPPHR